MWWLVDSLRSVCEHAFPFILNPPPEPRDARCEQVAGEPVITVRRPLSRDEAETIKRLWGAAFGGAPAGRLWPEDREPEPARPAIDEARAPLWPDDEVRRAEATR